MAKDKTYEELMKLAQRYNVQDNELFRAAAQQYSVQMKVIEEIKKTLDEEDSLLATKEYVKGRENIYANPLVRELPKHSDSANKTLRTMLDVIKELGREQADASSKLERLMRDE